MLELGYIILSFVMLLLIILGYRTALTKVNLEQKKRNKKMIALIGIVASWMVYIFVVERSGILLNMDMPPKFPLFIFLPFFIFLIIFYVRNKDNPIIHAIPLRWPIFYQTFRIVVELLLLYTFYRSIIPVQATFEGLNFDILMGITAPFVALFVYRKTAVNKYIAYFWNILGIIMVLFVGFIIASGIYFPAIWGASESIVAEEFTKMPFLLIPAFLAPSAIFVHVVSLIQLRNQD